MSISNTDNYLTSEDIDNRIDELDEELTERYDEYSANEENTPLEWPDWLAEFALDDEVREYKILLRFRDDCDVSRSSWACGINFVHEDYFEEDMDEMIKDSYLTCREIPSFMTIDYESLKMDYSEVDFDGQTYYFRA